MKTAYPRKQIDKFESFFFFHVKIAFCFSTADKSFSMNALNSQTRIFHCRKLLVKKLLKTIFYANIYRDIMFEIMLISIDKFLGSDRSHLLVIHTTYSLSESVRATFCFLLPLSSNSIITRIVFLQYDCYESSMINSLRAFSFSSYLKFLVVILIAICFALFLKGLSLLHIFDFSTINLLK